MARRSSNEAVSLIFEHGLYLPTRTIVVSGDIDGEAYVKLLCSLKVLGQSVEPIEILLNSPGGSTIDGMAMYDLVSKCSNYVTIHVFGEASSMASVILQAADHRVMAKHAVLMLHDGSDSATDLHCRDFERRANESRRSREEMYEIFAERTKKSVAYFRRKCGRDWYLTAEQALREGLVDGLC